MFKIISLNPNEGVASVADKIINCPNHQVYLLLSKENDLFGDLFSLKLLRREADKNNKELILIVPAKKEGINLDVIKKAKIKMIFENELEDFVNTIQETENEIKANNYNKNKIFTSNFNQTKENSDIKSFNPKEEIGNRVEESNSSSAEKNSVFTPDKEAKLFNASRNFLIILIILSLLVVGVVAYLFLGKTIIVISPHQDESVFQKTIIASRNINRPMASSDQIPAEVITLSKMQKKNFSATGIKTIKKKAKGEIIIYNQFSSQPQKLVATTRFETTDGKIFRLINPIIVPGAKVENGKIVASSIKAKVIADRPGSDYNIGPSSFTIPGFKGSPKYRGFYAQSSQPMSGGEISDAKIVTSDDLSRAKSVLKKDFIDNSEAMTQELIKKIPDGYKILNGKTNYIRGKITCSAEINAITDNFSCQERQKVEAIVFKKLDVISLIKMDNSDFFDNKIIVLNKSKINYTLINNDFTNYQIKFKVNAKIITRDKINQQRLKIDLMGKNRAEVKNIISQKYSNIDQVEIYFWPVWVKKIPQNINRIKIKIK